MNSEKRVLKAIDFQFLDRIPVWDNYWGGFVDNWQKYKKTNVHPTEYYGIDISIELGDETLFPSQKRVLRADKEFLVKNDGWGRIVRVGKRDSYFAETLEYLVNEHSDLYKLNPEPATMESRYKEFAKNVQRVKDAGRCVFAKIGGIYCRSQFVRGEDRLLMDMALDESFCNDFFDRIAGHLESMALETLKRAKLWNTGLFVYDDMANNNAPMFSPAMFEKYLLPRYKKIIRTVKNAGCKHVFFHSDGNILPLLDLLLEAGFEGFNPLEPRCGLDLIKLRERYGRKMVFFGGVCNTIILPSGDKKKIEKHIRPLIELAKEGGVILGQASIGDDISPEAYDFYMSLIKKYGN